MLPFRIALQALARQRVRTLLTALGISIGIAAVICTVALGAGSTADIETQLDALGDEFVWIRAGSANVGGVRGGWGSRRSLTVADAMAIPMEVPDVVACSPIVSGREQVIAGNRNWNTRYVGISPEYLDIRKWRLRAGWSFDASDVSARAKVAILGVEVARRLYGDEDPIGQPFRMGRFPFRVIGLLTPRGADRTGVNQDDAIVIPYTTAMRNIEGITWVNEIICSTASAESTPAAEAGVANLLRVRHGLGPDDPDDFSLQYPQEALQLRLASMQTLGLMLTAVALVSLVVGGVGIMNIMLVSVTERTREVGLRMALGAREADIRRQFLAESLLLGLAGAALGVILGHAGTWLIAEWFGWAATVSTDALVAAVVFALGAGFVFGFYPATRASALSPVEAMRLE
jgi:putative ABC transport system permease protein